jgi:hypothetical protein
LEEGKSSYQGRSPKARVAQKEKSADVIVAKCNEPSVRNKIDGGLTNKVKD